MIRIPITRRCSGGKVEKWKSYKELEVWKVSMDFVTEIYKLTAKFPSFELYSITSQIRRCAVSIPSNIAESSGRRNNKEFIKPTHNRSTLPPFHPSTVPPFHHSTFST
jgi:hypothetical protein